MKNKKYYISVIVASYNYAKYIRETLDSIANQSYKDFEVIIVDDGSQDNSLDIIREFTARHSNYKLYMHKKNKGLCASILLALKHAEGKYIAFCESDDFWHRDYLKEKVQYIKNNPTASIIASGITSIGEKHLDNFISDSEYFLKAYANKNNLFKYFWERTYIPTFSAVMIRTDVLKECDFNAYIEAWLDYWLYLQITLKHKIGFVNKKLTYWRIHKNSFIKRNNKKGNKLTKNVLFKLAFLNLAIKTQKGKILVNLFANLAIYLIQHFFSIRTKPIKNGFRVEIYVIGLGIKFRVQDLTRR